MYSNIALSLESTLYEFQYYNITTSVILQTLLYCFHGKCRAHRPEALQRIFQICDDLFS